MSNELATMFKVDMTEDSLNELEKFASLDLSAAEKSGKFRDAFMTAVAVVELRKLISGRALEYICALQNNRLGFITDSKSRGTPYPNDVIRDCVIEAVLRGAKLVGNEFNILAGNCYFTQSFFRRKLKELPGLTELVLNFDIPKISAQGATVRVVANWKFNGTAMQRIMEIATRVNAGQGADAIQGKADRKARAAIYQQLTGTSYSDGDIDDIPTRAVVGTVVDSGMKFTKAEPTSSTVSTSPAVVKIEAAPEPVPAPAPQEQAQVVQPQEAPPEEPKKRGRPKKEAAPVEAQAAPTPAPVEPEEAPAGNEKYVDPKTEKTDETDYDRIMRYKQEQEEGGVPDTITSQRANWSWTHVTDDMRAGILEVLGMKDTEELKAKATMKIRQGIIVAAADMIDKRGLFQ
jgi:hypothetical protein